jgi:hypothetical protein
MCHYFTVITTNIVCNVCSLATSYSKREKLLYFVFFSDRKVVLVHKVFFMKALLCVHMPFFAFIFMYFIQYRFLCRRSGSPASEDAGIARIVASLRIWNWFLTL